MILGLGASPNQRLSWSNVDWTPLALAISRTDSVVVETLLDHGADPNQRWCVSIDSNPDRRTRAAECTLQNGFTPLTWATSLGRTDIVSALVDHRADPLLRDWQGRTAAD